MVTRLELRDNDIFKLRELFGDRNYSSMSRDIYNIKTRDVEALKISIANNEEVLKVIDTIFALSDSSSLVTVLHYDSSYESYDVKIVTDISQGTITFGLSKAFTEKCKSHVVVSTSDKEDVEELQKEAWDNLAPLNKLEMVHTCISLCTWDLNKELQYWTEEI